MCLWLDFVIFSSFLPQVGSVERDNIYDHVHLSVRHVVI